MIECGENCRFRTGGRAFHRQGNLGVGKGTCTRPARILWGVEFGAGNLDKVTQVLIERVTDSDELLPIQQCGHGFTEARLVHTPGAYPSEGRRGASVNAEGGRTKQPQH